ncbi:MAG: aldo/keto reductase [Kiritimatiellae bacterium]|nr:aldo/keto reductase [Kiritimatiellia bacterium]
MTFEAPVIFGTSCLGNLYRVVPPETKRAIAAEWFKAFPKPVIDSAGKYGAGLSLEAIGAALEALGKRPGDLAISVKLGWRRKPLTTPEPTFEPGVWAGLAYDAEQDISYDGILRCYEEAKTLLRGFPIDYVSVHDPDEYLAARGEAGRADILGAYEALFALKAKGEVRGVGIGSKSWEVIRELSRDVPFDWAMFACEPTLLRHSAASVEFVRELKGKGVGLIGSALFNGGFLLGSGMLDYLKADPVADAGAFAFRARYLALCDRYRLDPAVPAVRYAFRLGFDAVALNTSNPARILQNAAYAKTKVREEYWRELGEG